MVGGVLLLLSVLLDLALMHALVLLCVSALPIHHFFLGGEEAVDGFRWHHVDILLLLQKIQVLLYYFLGLFIVLVVLMWILEVIEGFFEVDLDHDSDDCQDLSDRDESHNEEGEDQGHLL